MADVGIRDLKNDVSRYVQRVEAGETITVTKRGRPVARLVPTGVPAGVERLLAEGRLHWSGRKPPRLPEPGRLRGTGQSAADYVSEGRR